MFCVFLGGNWQGQMLLGVTVIFLFVSASPPACCDCSVMRRIVLGPCVTQVALCLVSFLQILTTLFSNGDGSCEFSKMQMMRSCVFEILC